MMNIKWKSTFLYIVSLLSSLIPDLQESTNRFKL